MSTTKLDIFYVQHVEVYTFVFDVQTMQIIIHVCVIIIIMCASFQDFPYRLQTPQLSHIIGTY